MNGNADGKIIENMSVKTVILKKGKLDRAKPFDYFNVVLMVFLGLITLFPFYYMVIVSIGTQSDIIRSSLYMWPKQIDFSAYQLIMKSGLLTNAFMITVFITVVGTSLSVIFSIMGAYTLSRKTLPGRNIFFLLMIITMFFSGGLIPFYLIVRSMGMMNNLTALIFPHMLSAFNLILLKNYFEELPYGIEEAAKIDGANDVQVLWLVVVPVSLPVIMTITLFYAVSQWNDYFSAMIFISNRSLYPLQTLLRTIVTDYDQASNIFAQQYSLQYKQTYTLSVQMACIVISTIPILLFYPWLQKYFTKGVILGGIKE